MILTLVDFLMKCAIRSKISAGRNRTFRSSNSILKSKVLAQFDKALYSHSVLIITLKFAKVHQ